MKIIILITLLFIAGFLITSIITTINELHKRRKAKRINVGQANKDKSDVK